MSLLQYLTRFAEPESTTAPPRERYSHVLVVPAFDEEPSFVHTLWEPHPEIRPLFVVVVNCSPDASAAEIQRTRYLLGALATGSTQLAPAVYLTDTLCGSTLVIDRASDGRMLPSRQGVGLARKIGCDIALAWIHQQVIDCPFLLCTDADGRLPRGYFQAATAMADDTTIAGLAYPFWHDAEKTSVPGRALDLYECSLRYYVLGLHWAGSPYAFHSIGSTMAVRSSVYAMVRGMPKRLAGEDFYLLNKASKEGRIAVPDCPPIRLAQRSSSRTPFGTGAKTREFASLLAAGKDVCVYNPKSFALLREWLDTLSEVSSSRDAIAIDTLSHEELRSALPLDTDEVIRRALRECPTKEVLATRLERWFDGFQTLKLIHRLRENGLPDLPYAEAFAMAPFVPEPQEARSLRQTLARREAQLGGILR